MQQARRHPAPAVHIQTFGRTGFLTKRHEQVDRRCVSFAFFRFLAPLGQTDRPETLSHPVPASRRWILTPRGEQCPVQQPPQCRGYRFPVPLVVPGQQPTGDQRADFGLPDIEGNRDLSASPPFPVPAHPFCTTGTRCTAGARLQRVTGGHRVTHGDPTASCSARSFANSRRSSSMDLPRRSSDTETFARTS